MIKQKSVVGSTPTSGIVALAVVPIVAPSETPRVST